ncbi:hypothetical protein H4Q26_017186 [Puccinia striiformis f. sp. tritici PST-130]|nr:hypothetical protein H4Q26_017186 [Puccinia striiformis f. sp. tritici PST-130]
MSVLANKTLSICSFGDLEFCSSNMRFVKLFTTRKMKTYRSPYRMSPPDSLTDISRFCDPSTLRIEQGNVQPTRGNSSPAAFAITEKTTTVLGLELPPPQHQRSKYTDPATSILAQPHVVPLLLKTLRSTSRSFHPPSYNSSALHIHRPTMWSSNNQSNPKRLTTNLKQLKLAYKAPEPQPAPPSAISDISATTESSTNPSTWRKELKLTRVVERERKKLSTATASSCSTSTSYSSTSLRTPPTPSDLPRLDDRLSMLDEKLEAVENISRLREIKRNSQPPEPPSEEQTLTQPSMETGTTQSATSESGGATDQSKEEVQKTCSHHALQSKLQGTHTTLHSSLADTHETSSPYLIRHLQSTSSIYPPFPEPSP